MTAHEIAAAILAQFRERSQLRAQIATKETRLHAIEAEIRRLSDLVPEEQFPPEAQALIDRKRREASNECA
jgi:hypothetical protein